MHGEPQESALERTADDRTRGSAVAGHERPRPLSLVEKAGFSLGDAACNIFFQTWIIFSTIFYTDVVRARRRIGGVDVPDYQDLGRRRGPGGGPDRRSH